MNYRTNNYGSRCLPPGCSIKTDGELTKLVNSKDLTPKDVENFRWLRVNSQRFLCPHWMINSVSSLHINEPCAAFFMDIKGTLYASGTHFSDSGILGRSSLDAIPIQYDHIEALGYIISRTSPQDFRLSYDFSNNYELEPTNSAYADSLVERPPHIMDERPLHRRPKYMTKYGPFNVVFISADLVETQKTIVSFLYYMALFLEKKSALRNLGLFGLDPVMAATLSTEENIAYIEKRLLKYGNDFDKFLELEDRNFARLEPEEIAEFKATINGLTFLSTTETGKTKEQLMEEVLESPSFQARMGNYYKLFALGDNYCQDGGMLRRAFEADGIGLMVEREDHSGSIKLMGDLSNRGINLSYIPTVSSISQFWCEVMKILTRTREEELLDAMICANRGVSTDTAFETAPVKVRLMKRAS